MSDWINNLDRESFVTAKFPKKDVFRDSLFYPASGHDWSPIRHWDLGVGSFVYVDTFMSEEQHLAEIAQSPFAGYQTWATRHVKANELTPAGWRLQMPPGIDQRRYIRAMTMAQATQDNSFAQWTIFERIGGFGEEYGPKRFSLFFIRGEGAATYQALYGYNKVLPKVLAIIRPGLGYGGNYSDFEHVLLATMKMHSKRLPEKLLYWYMASNPDLNLLDRGANNPWADWYDLTTISESWPKDDEPDFRLALFAKKHNIR